VIELQAHSTVSDGELAPAGVVAAAADAGVTTLALPDHDAVDGVSEAARAAAERGIDFVPAVEMSAAHPSAEELHVCGYGVALEGIAPACERAQQERVERAREICERLTEVGVEVRLEDAIAEAGDARSVGRPHIARAAGAADMKPFFESYLIPGTSTYVPRRWPSTGEAIDLIQAAGGAAVLAHPFWDLADTDEVVALVEELPWDGVECFYPTHSREQAALLVETCERLGLAVTASSDFHGPGHKMFSSFGAYETYGIGEPAVPHGH
jgi:predicted metal-dependent phosphoesterase TrpH